MNKKSEIVIIRWEDESFTVTYEGITSMTDIRLMEHALEKDARKRRARALGFAESIYLSEAEKEPLLRNPDSPT